MGIVPWGFESLHPHTNIRESWRGRRSFALRARDSRRPGPGGRCPLCADGLACPLVRSQQQAVGTGVRNVDGVVLLSLCHVPNELEVLSIVYAPRAVPFLANAGISLKRFGV